MTDRSAPSWDNTDASRRPVLGVIACNRVVGGEIASSVMRRYLESASRFMNASLVIVPSLPEFVDAPYLASMIDGCLLTGSPSNIAADRYGDPDATAEGPFDEERDEVVLRMISEMIKVGKPVLGICRGLQEINVALGGTLQRDLAASGKYILHHAPADHVHDAMFKHSHEVLLTHGGVLASSLGRTSLVVNSVHYQGIDRLAADLSVEATAPDGLIEAVSTRINQSPILAVQWHPEWQTHNHPESQALFRLFGEILRGKPFPARNVTSIS